MQLINSYFSRDTISTLAGFFQANNYAPEEDDKIHKSLFRTDINNNIQLFQQSLTELKAIDQKIALAFSANTLLWLTNMLSTSASLMGHAALYWYTQYGVARQEKFAEFQKYLSILLNDYQLLIKDKKPDITQNFHVIHLATVLSPFVSADVLIPWDLEKTKSADLAPQFRQIFTTSPHRFRFVGVENTQIKKDYMGGEVASDIDKPTKNKNSNKWFGIFEQSIAEITMAVYGHQPNMKPR